jgi:hypothetical protein
MAMLRTSLKRAWFVLVACVLSAGVVRAGPLDTLFNTGVDASGAVLPDGTVGDPHYTLISIPAPTPPIQSTTDIRIRDYAAYGDTSPYGPGYPMWQYVGDDSKSRWIGPNSVSMIDDGDGTGIHPYYWFDGPVGDYLYETTFDLTGFDPATAIITGQWSTDDFGVDILINGHSTANVNNTPYTQWTPFSITSGFVTGMNTLDFGRGSNPTDTLRWAQKRTDSSR